MKALALVSTLALGLASCVHSSAFHGPDGQEGFVISCNGRANSMANCYNKAYDECHGPYTVVTGHDNQRVSYNYVNGDPMVTDHREITVVCGNRAVAQ